MKSRNKIKIGYDDNLGLPGDFSEALDCELIAYHDLGNMISAFERKILFAVFVPTGTLPYLSKYEILTQALIGIEQIPTLQTKFIALEPIAITEIPNQVIGRVNRYCTTSFWAP